MLRQQGMTMKNRLFKKFYVSTVVSVIISLSLLMILLSFSVSQYLSREKKQLLTENCKTISNVATETVGNSDFNAVMANVIAVMARAIDSEIFLTDSSGKVFLCSCSEWRTNLSCVHSQGHVSKSVMEPTVNGEYFEMGNLNGRYKDVFYTAGRPLSDRNGRVIGAVFASSPASVLQDFLSNLVRIFVVCALVPVVLLFITVYAICYRLTRPLQLMSEAAHSMAKGDFSKRIPVQGDDEISDLAIAFNQMTNSLVQLESMRRSFVGNVSHELKTPMTTIGGFIDGIIDGTIEDNRQKYYLGIVSEEIKRLSRLVQSMLSLAKLESGELKIQPEPFDFYKLLCSIVVSQEQRIEKKRIEIRGLENMDETIINADSDLIHQVVYNLLDNAIKFTNDNGYIEFKLEANEKNASLFIRNSGQGIKNADLPKVFERFYKGDKARSQVKDSTGLGLYIVKTIVDIHGGKITVRSLEGEYTEFEVGLPR
ncbi:MAG: HAMP domain-containing sensor histidine kinase [Oscillospiraceae bacterium]